MKTIRTLFIGTSDFAIPILTRLVKIDFIDLVGVVTQPDKPTGRHHSELKPSAVADYAKDIENLKLFKPEKLKDEAGKILEETSPELIIVASFGQMIPNEMLEYPKFGCINVHASLLPKLRGAVPIPMAILQGLEETGISFQKMIDKLDAGDVIKSFRVKISDDETTKSLSKKLSSLAGGRIEEVIKGWIEGGLEASSQNDSEATYCVQKDISKEKAQITPDTEVAVAERMIRAFYSWPVAWGFVGVNGEEKRLKIFKAKIGDLKIETKIEFKQHGNAKTLEIVKNGKGLFVPLKGGALELEEIQLEGKERKAVSEYLYLASHV
ncbi:methionyl-tRNA formyltransferase [Candidatus Dojkabacteria bacterium]|nr:methionyl-tRNA formyltransferase [Candidatus Dojkabacteria bacterium]